MNTQSNPKGTINETILYNWPTVEMAQITSDGNYCGYIINIEAQNLKQLILVDLGTNKIIESTIKGEYIFSPDSKIAIWINIHDSLCIAILKTFIINYTPNVSIFNFNNGHLSYLNNGHESHLEVRVNSDKLSLIATANKFMLINNKKRNLFLQKEPQNQQIIFLERKKRRKRKIIWKGFDASNFIIDKTNGQIAFLTGTKREYLWYYKINSAKIDSFKISVDSTFSISELSHFSKNGSNLYIYLKEKSNINLSLNKNSAIIWSYLDSELKSEQIMSREPRIYTGIICLSNQRITRLDKGNDWLFFPKEMDTVALIRHHQKKASSDEINWNSETNFSWYIISLNNTENILHLNDINNNPLAELSPAGKYVIYYDKAHKHYFVCETQTGKRRNITQDIKENWEKDIFSKNYGKRISGWQTDDASVFINGEYDIWQIDPSGRLPPLNLTNGYGKEHNIVFSLSLDEYSKRSFLKNEQLILSAFNIETKENGFFKKKSGTSGIPDSLTIGPYIYTITDNPTIPADANYSPIKAAESLKYIVRRMNAKEAPNYFITTNFKDFQKLSDLHPERGVNWYKPELHKWLSLSAQPLQGILYKPENFDTSRKYPIIVQYYERKSDGLNAYLTPRLLENGCSINIPYYVSNGYLIFCPDINYKTGDPMQGTYDAIVSAASYLAKLSYVDSTKMGIQGCSWGGIQTNYLVTHSNLFAAACSASGISNWISSYNSIVRSGGSMQGMYELGQFRIGATLWERPDIYIKNSSVLSADKLTTPLLLMHTIDDGLCNFNNILELFTAFRRLGKKSWMLVYEGNHGIWGVDAIDYSSRMKQFFDHYLKKYPVPNWMQQSSGRINTNIRGGLNLDKRLQLQAK